jgi:hypothetical protein
LKLKEEGRGTIDEGGRKREEGRQMTVISDQKNKS